MSKVCEICGKRRQVGYNVSHAHNRTKKVFQPNVQKIRVLTGTGQAERKRVCTSCIRSGKVQKPTA
jgi:large subunit ribosomal protein L28